MRDEKFEVSKETGKKNSNTDNQKKSLDNYTEKLYHKEKLYADYISLLSEVHERERIVKSIVSGIRETLDLDIVLKTAVDDVGRFLGVDRCLIALQDKNLLKFNLQNEYRASGNISSVLDGRLLDDMPETWNKSLVGEKIPILISDNETVTLGEDERQYLAFYNIKSLAVIPLVYKEELLGIIILHHIRSNREWKSNHIETIKNIGTQIAIAIKQAELYLNLKGRVEREDLIRRITSSIIGSLDIDEILSIICDEVAKLFDVQRATIVEMPDNQNYGKWIVRREYKARSDVKGLNDVDYNSKMGVYNGIVLLEQGRNLIIPNIYESDTPDYYKNTYESMGVKSILAVPVKKKEDKWGTIFLTEYDTYRYWSQDDINLLETIADQTYIAIHQSRLYSNIKQKAERELVLRKITNAIRSSLDISEVFKIIGKEVAVLFDVERVAIVESKEEDPQNPILRCEYFPRGGIDWLQDYDVRVHEYWRRLLLEKEDVVVIDNLSNYEVPDYFKRTYKCMGVKSILGAGIKKGAHKWGAITLHKMDSYRNWSRDEIILLEMIAEQIYVAIKQAELYSETKIQAERELVLRNTISTIRGTLDITEIKRNVITEIGKFFNADRCFMLESGNDLNKMAKIDFEYLSSPSAKSILAIDVNHEKIKYWSKIICIDCQEVIITDMEGYIKSNNLANSHIVELMEDYNISARIGVPILYGNQVHGALVLHFGRKIQYPSKEEMDFIKTLANQLGIALYQSRLYLTTKRQAERERLLRNTISTIRETLDADEIRKRVVTEIGKYFNANRCLIHELDHTFNKPAQTGFEYLSSPSEKSILQIDFDSEKIRYWSRMSFDGKEEVIVPDMEEYIKVNGFENPHIAELINEYNIKSLMGIPILHSGQIQGTLILHFNREIQYPDDEEMEFIRTLANQVGIALYQSRLYLTTKKQAEREALLRKIVTVIRSTLDINEIKKSIVTEIGKVLDADRVFIVGYNPETNTPQGLDRYSEYLSSSKYKSFIGFDFAGPEVEFFRNIHLQAKPIVIDDLHKFVQANNLAGSEVENWLKDTGVKAGIGITLSYQGRIFGVLSIHYIKKTVTITSEQKEFIYTLGDQISIALHQSGLYLTTKKQAEREAVLRKIITLIRSTLDINKIKINIVTEIGKAFNSDRCAIYELGKKPNLFSEYLSSSNKKTLLTEDVERDDTLKHLININVKEKKELIVIDADEYIRQGNLQESPIKKHIEDYNIKTGIGIPILDGDKVFGILILHFTREKCLLTEQDLEFLRTLANQTGIALNQSKLYLTTKKQAEREALLRKIVIKIRNSFDINDIKQTFATEIAKTFGADRIVIGEIDVNNYESYNIDYEYLASDKVKSILDTNFSNVNYLKEVLRNVGEIVVEDFEKLIAENPDIDPDFVNLTRQYEIKAGIGVPILYSDEILGVLAVHYVNRTVSFSPEDVEFFKTLANQLGIAFYKARLYENLEQNVERESLLRKITNTIRSTLDIEQVLNTICKEISDLFEVDRASILDFSEENTYKEWVVKCEYKRNDCIVGLSDVNFDKNIGEFWSKHMLNGETVLAIDNLYEMQAPEYIKEFYKKLEMKSVLSVPICKGENTLGILILAQYSKFRHWDQKEIDLLQTISDQIYLSIRQAEMYSTIKKQLDRESRIRSDDSIIVNRNLADNIGLNCAISYSALVSDYNYYKDAGNLLEDGFIAININNLREVTYLSIPEQKDAIQKLFEAGLIEYEKSSQGNIYIKIVEDESLLKHYLSEQKLLKKDKNSKKSKKTEQPFCSISELYKIYSKYYSKYSVDAVIYFLEKSGQNIKDKSTKMSKLYFAVICRTLFDFMDQYSLDLLGIKSVIDEWFNKKKNAPSQSVISFGVSNKILLSRLKKILFFRLQEAKGLATDFGSKMDFYSDLDFTLPDGLDFDDEPDEDD